MVALLQFRQIDRVIAAFSQIIEDKRQTRSIEGKLHRDESEIRELHFCALYGSMKVIPALLQFVIVCNSFCLLQFARVTVCYSLVKVKAIAGFVTVCYSLQELQFVTVW